MLHLDTESIMAVVMAAKWQEYYNDDLTTQEEKAATEELERVKLFLPYIDKQAEADRLYEAALSAFIAGYKQGVELALSLNGLNGENLDAVTRDLAKTEADFTGGRARVGAKKS